MAKHSTGDNVSLNKQIYFVDGYTPSGEPCELRFARYDTVKIIDVYDENMYLVQTESNHTCELSGDDFN